MVSPELIRRYRFFAGLDQDGLVLLAGTANEVEVESGHCFFEEGDELKSFFLVLEGAVSLGIAVPNHDASQTLAGQLTGEFKTKYITVSTVGSGDIFGWSALIPPTNSSAKAVAITPCRVIEFYCQELLQRFEQDQSLGYVMLQKAAQIVRERLRDMRIESLAFRDSRANEAEKSVA